MLAEERSYWLFLKMNRLMVGGIQIDLFFSILVSNSM